MAETKLSVVVTFFNKGKLLHNALESQFFHLYNKIIKLIVFFQETNINCRHLIA